MAEIKIRLKDVSVIYPNGDGVKDINLDIYENEILTLLGPSGCGKSTILRALGGFNKLSKGRIEIEGEDVGDFGPEKRPTSMVFQGYNLWNHMSVYENLAYGLKLRKIEKKVIDEKVKGILKLFNMSGFEKKYPSQMSGGQQQRIAIARSILIEPKVLLMDEPFSALDAKIREQMRMELRRIQKKLRISVVFVTHDQEEAISISDRIVVMDKGKIVQVSSPNDIYENPVSPYVASFVGTMNFIEANNKLLAFRPEETKLYEDDRGKYKAKISQIVLMGHYYQVKLDSAFGEIIVFVNRLNIDNFIEGMKVSFDISNFREYERN
ncbi:MAG: ABC transporter ATP-binding protein [Peptoniphilaceae bacterium]|nr:ABC transporter ATP-binding protein [Peptoniphilaceae bacterium]MDY6018075.1 ABC transporter ATP-binding protein [Anaerococcus sp.]